MKTQYYALFSCDEWKSHSSYGFRGVFTIRELKKQIRKGLRKNYFEYEGSVRDIEKMSVDDLHNKVNYLSITPLYINEEL